LDENWLGFLLEWRNILPTIFAWVLNDETSSIVFDNDHPRQ
jgi:hypothetical protein